MSDRGSLCPSLKERLAHLMHVTVPPGGKSLTTRELARQVTEAGFRVSHTYIAKLLNGKTDDPSINCLRALGKVFGVPAAYFLHDEVTEKVNRDLDLLSAIRDGDVRIIALGARGLSPGSRESVLNGIRHLRKLEGLNADLGLELTSEEA